MPISLFLVPKYSWFPSHAGKYNVAICREVVRGPKLICDGLDGAGKTKGTPWLAGCGYFSKGAIPVARRVRICLY